MIGRFHAHLSWEVNPSSGKGEGQRAMERPTVAVDERANPLRVTANKTSLRWVVLRLREQMGRRSRQTVHQDRVATLITSARSSREGPEDAGRPSFHTWGKNRRHGAFLLLLDGLRTKATINFKERWRRGGHGRSAVERAFNDSPAALEGRFKGRPRALVSPPAPATVRVRTRRQQSHGVMGEGRELDATLWLEG